MKRWFDLTPPRGGIAFMAGAFIAASLWFIIREGDSWYTRWVCPWFLPIGIGLWLKHAWARWLSFAFFLLLTVFFVIVSFEKGISARTLIQGIIIAGSLFALWEWEVYPEEVETILRIPIPEMEDEDV